MTKSHISSRCLKNSSLFGYKIPNLGKLIEVNERLPRPHVTSFVGS